MTAPGKISVAATRIPAATASRATNARTQDAPSDLARRQPRSYAVVAAPAHLADGVTPRPAGPACEPLEHGVVPENRVRRLDDPMVLVGEVQESRRHAAPLKAGEHRQALHLADPVVERSVDHERRDTEIGDVVHGVVPCIAGRVVPRRPTVLPFREPELLRRQVREPLVEAAVV